MAVETQRRRRDHFSLVLSNRSSNFHQSVVKDTLNEISVSLLQSSVLRTGRSLAHLLWFPQTQYQTHRSMSVFKISLRVRTLVIRLFLIVLGGCSLK